MRSIGEFIMEWIPIFFIVKYRISKEEKKIKKEFYSNPLLQKCDRALLSYYRFLNPYTIAKDFFLARGSNNPYQYGETPLTSLAYIAKECDLTSNDYIIDLGCGRGRGVFFLSHLLQCRVHGIEWIPRFVSLANSIKMRFSCTKISFSCENMLEANFTKATVIYLYGTCLEEASIRILIQSLKQAPAHTKIITVSYPLSDYADPGLFSLEKSFMVSFPWGKADVFLQKTSSVTKGSEEV